MSTLPPFSPPPLSTTTQNNFQSRAASPQGQGEFSLLPRVPLCYLFQKSLCIDGRWYLLGLEPHQKLTVIGNYISSSAACGT